MDGEFKLVLFPSESISYNLIDGETTLVPIEGISLILMEGEPYSLIKSN